MADNERTYPMLVGARRLPEPLTQDQIDFLGQTSMRQLHPMGLPVVGCDSSITIALVHDGDEMQCNILLGDGRRVGKTAMSCGTLDARELFKAWILLAQTIAALPQADASHRDLVRALLDTENDRRRMDDAARRRQEAKPTNIDGAPPWVWLRHDIIGFDIDGAFSEQLGFDLGDRVRELGVAAQVPWDIFLAEMNKRIAELVVRRTKPPQGGITIEYVQDVANTVRAEVKRAIRDRKHPPLQVGS